MKTLTYKNKGNSNNNMAKSNFKKRNIKVKKINSRKVNTGIGKLFGTIFMPLNVPKDKSPKQLNIKQKPRGRPEGASGRYVVPGRGAVGVYEYRKWLSEQMRLKRIQGVLAKKPIQQTQYQEPPMSDEEILIQQVKQSRRMSNQAAPGDLELLRKIRQMQEQQKDNILKAPQINKGELRRNIPKIKIPSILDAPNFAKGELRNVNVQKSNVGTFNEYGEMQMFDNQDKLSPYKPISNPQGDEYVEINVANGQPIPQKRPREKWADGSAL